MDDGSKIIRTVCLFILRKPQSHVRKLYYIHFDMCISSGALVIVLLMLHKYTVHHDDDEGNVEDKHLLRGG